MIEALSNWLDTLLGKGRSSDRFWNSLFSFSLLIFAADLDLSFMSSAMTRGIEQEVGIVLRQTLWHNHWGMILMITLYGSTNQRLHSKDSRDIHKLKMLLKNLEIAASKACLSFFRLLLTRWVYNWYARVTLVFPSSLCQSHPRDCLCLPLVPPSLAFLSHLLFFPQTKQSGQPYV